MGTIIQLYIHIYLYIVFNVKTHEWERQREGERNGGELQLVKRRLADWTALNSALALFVKKVLRKNNQKNAINYGKMWQQQQEYKQQKQQQDEPYYKSVIYSGNILWQCQNGNHLSKHAQF